MKTLIIGLTLVALICIAPLPAHTATNQRPEWKRFYDRDILSAAQEAEIVVKGQVTAVQELGRGDYLLDARSVDRSNLDKYKATVKVLRRIKGTVGDTIEVGFFSPVGVVALTPLEQGETVILCLSKVDNMLIGANHLNWKFPASAVTDGEASADLKTALGEEMVSLLNESDVSSKMIAFIQLGFWLHYTPSLPEVREYLHDQNQMLRFAACEAIMCLLDYDTLPEVWRVLDEPLENDSSELTNAFHRTRAAMSYLMTKPQAIPHLAALLESNKPILREAAAALLCFGEPMQRFLIDALKSSKRETRLTALTALGKISKDPSLQPSAEMSMAEESRLISYWQSVRTPLIINGGFEESTLPQAGIPPESWGGSMRKGGIFIVDGSVAHSGNKSLKLSTTGEGDTASVHTVVSEPLGHQVKVSGYYKTEGFAMLKVIGLIAVDYGPLDGGSYLRDEIQVEPSEGRWTYFEKVMNLVGPVQARARISVGLMVGPGAVWVDDLKMESIDN